MSELLIADTLTGEKKLLKPLRYEVQLFVCGPTVYDDAHIGHARTYVAFDVIARWIRQAGFSLRYIQNITDVDDKIIEKARAQRQKAMIIAQTFEERYHEDMQSLRIDEKEIQYARASDYIPQIIDQVERLIAGKHAYATADGSVYFSVPSFEEYGKLSRQNIEKTEQGVRIAIDQQKLHPSDFVVWRGRIETDIWEPTWKSPAGKGRPGWHIEDTAIAEKEFGYQYDLHGGARDLIFPHHEGEIAIMESLSGKSPMVNHWLHTGFLNIMGEKMSKSEGNVITIRALLENYRAEDLRLFILQSHYRSPIDYNEQDVKSAAQAVNRLGNAVKKLDTIAGGVCAPHHDLFSNEIAAITDAMNDDFQTPAALGAIFNALKRINAKMDSESLTQDDACDALGFFTWIDRLFGIVPPKPLGKIPPPIMQLVEQREEARAAANWTKADLLRNELAERGYDISDTATGPDIRKR